MSKPISRTAEVALKELDAEGVTIELVELAKVLGLTELDAKTVVSGATRTLKTKIKQYRDADVTVELPSPADDTDSSTTTEPVAKVAKATKTTKHRGPRGGDKLRTSNRPPLIRRTTAGARAASDLIEYLEQFEVPAAFPINFRQATRNGVKMVKGTTVDGEEIEITLAEAIQNLGRRDDLCFAIPLFGRNVEMEIVTRVAKLDGAPAEDATDENDLRLYQGRKAWFYNMLQIGIRIWAGLENPPSLDLKKHPHREFQEDGTTKIRTTTFRYRSATIGFVSQVKDAFDQEVLASDLRGGKLREFRANWIDEFIAGDRKVRIGRDQTEKSFFDFKVDGRQGTAEQFKLIWDKVETTQLASSRPAPRRSTRGR
jgi:hypothetical protein